MLVLALGFLLLGNRRATGLLSWRVIQPEAITPSKIGRGGLKPGKKAPGFTPPNPAGAEVDAPLGIFSRIDRPEVLSFLKSVIETYQE